MMLIQKFIQNNTNWEDLLTSPPYTLKISRYNGLIKFKYNQLSSDFNNPLVREARGPIFIEDTMQCICYPFDKFGNYGESYCPDIQWSTASVQEKIDGSLILFYYNPLTKQWSIGTNGTINAFNSPLQNDTKFKNYGELVEYTLKQTLGIHWKTIINLGFNKKCTYMFELVSPYNQVVIPYKDTKLYFLGARNLKNNKELEPEYSYPSAYFDMPKRYSLKTLSDIQSSANSLPWDEEGYVVCDGNYNRVKIKSPQYIKAHYVRNNNTITKEKLIQLILNNEVEEFLIYASEYKQEIEKISKAIKTLSKKADFYVEDINTQYTPSIKEFAFKVSNYPKWVRDYLFKKYRNKNTTFKEYTKTWQPSRWKYTLEMEELI